MRILVLCLAMTAALAELAISDDHPVKSPSTDSRPDVLWIMVDDLRPMLGCYGDPRIHTPNIDRLARRGMVFERCYCQYAKCGTSRLSMLTGLRPEAIDVYSNNVRDVARFRKRMPEAVSIAAHLKLAGYRTQCYGKIYHDGWDQPSDWSVASSPGREREMLEVTSVNDPTAATMIADRYDCPVMQRPDVPDSHLFAGRMTDQVIDELNNFTPHTPRFLAVGYRRPHLPFVAPEKYYALYRPDASWLAADAQPSTQSPIMAWFNSDGYVGSAKKIGLSMPLSPSRDQAMAWNGYELRSYLGVPPVGKISVQLQIDLLHAYAACVSYVDAQIGRLLQALAQSSRPTIVILCSDHGWHLGEKSAWGKMTNFEVATRVPLIIAGPRIRPGRTREIAELVDLYPTICGLTDVQPPEHIEGDSLHKLLQTGEANDDACAISQYARFRNEYMGYAIRTARYRYVRWIKRSTGDVVARELYDHVHDPKESDNVAEDPDRAELIEDLNLRLTKALAR